MSSALLNASGAFAAGFPYPHWAWQHAIARFEAVKLGSGALAGKDLADAWDMHHRCGYVAHAQVEDEHLFPAVRKLPGGDEAIEKLEARHAELDKKGEEVAQAIAGGSAEVQGLLAQWVELLRAHMDEEEKFLVPLFQSLPAETRAELGLTLKNTMKKAPGGKMIMSLFRDLSAHQAVGEQYQSSFPAFLRFVLIPAFATFDGQYKEHRRIFGDLAAAAVAPLPRYTLNDYLDLPEAQRQSITARVAL